MHGGNLHKNNTETLLQSPGTAGTGGARQRRVARQWSELCERNPASATHYECMEAYKILTFKSKRRKKKYKRVNFLVGL